MSDEDFMNELEELTKSMSKEFKSNEKTKDSQTINNLSEDKSFCGFDLKGNELDYMKEIEKLLSLGGLSGDHFNNSDPQTNEMINLLNENLKDLEVKMNKMQKDIADNNQTDNKPELLKNTHNKSSNSNPFVETFNEMSDNKSSNGLFDMLKMLEGMNIPGGNPSEEGDIKNLYEILGKLSDNKGDNISESNKNKQLESLFGDLLEFLLKSDMLAEPLTQIKTSVVNYLEKNKDKLKPDEEEKYKSMLNYIETIKNEICKNEPNKALIIEVFYKLHELSDLDGEILSDSDLAFKQISDLLGGGNLLNK